MRVGAESRMSIVGAAMNKNGNQMLYAQMYKLDYLNDDERSK